MWQSSELVVPYLLNEDMWLHKKILSVNTNKEIVMFCGWNLSYEVFYFKSCFTFQYIC